MKKIILPIVLGLALVATSCESKLDIPQKGVMSSEEFYATGDAAAEALLANMYVTCFGNAGIAGTDGIYNPQLMLLNYSSDDILAAGGDAADHGDFRCFDEFDYDEANTPLKNLYNGYANSIFAANLIISKYTNENFEGAEPEYTSAVTAQCVAEARVFRAYMHMMEALVFNTPCIVDRILDPSELPTQASSQKEVLDFVIADCEKALASNALPKRNGAADKNATARMTRGFAQFVAGKAAMFNNDPATARKYLGDLINEGSYSLVDGKDYWKLSHSAGDGNSEVLFAPNFLEDPNFTNNAWGSGAPIQRGGWMIADVLCWRTDHLASTPVVCQDLPGAGGGWNGGAIQEDFAEKFLAHDGKSPRRLATFITEEEFLYEMEWPSDALPNWANPESKEYVPGRGRYIQSIYKPEGAEKADTTFTDDVTKDMMRGISDVAGVYSHSKYFEWKHMSFTHTPKLLSDVDYGKDYVAGLGANSNQTNRCIARYAEALLLYAEACIGADEAAGKAALNQIQKRAGVPETELTFQNVMDEKQFELWFEGARFHDLVRWAAQGKVNLDEIFNKSGFHDRIPIVTDDFFPIEKGVPSAPEHKFSVTYVKADYKPFEVGKHEYFPFPRDIKVGNPELKDVLGWAAK